MVPCSPAPRSLASLPASQPGPAGPAGPASRAELWGRLLQVVLLLLFLLLACGWDSSCSAALYQAVPGSLRGQAAFHPAVALIIGKQKAVQPRYLNVVEVSQPTLLAGCLRTPKVWGAGPIRRVGGGVCVLGWAGVPKFLRAPRHLGRVLASSCDTGMYFHALFPTYRYIGRAHALQRSHYLTLPRYSHLTYSCPPRPFSPATRIGEGRSARARVSRRPGGQALGSDQPAPLALPQNQPSTQHPPLSSVLQQFHSCKWEHHQCLRNCTIRSAQPSCATPSHSCIAASSHARFPLSFLTVTPAFSAKLLHT